jgi:hypothetical protein
MLPVQQEIADATHLGMILKYIFSVCIFIYVFMYLYICVFIYSSI